MSAQTSMIGRPARDLETPVLLVDLDTLDRNIARMRDVIVAKAGVGWRPHTKGIKVPALAHKLLRAGAMAVVLFGFCAHGYEQAYGLTQRPTIGAYLNDAMPPQPPAIESN